MAKYNNCYEYINAHMPMLQFMTIIADREYWSYYDDRFDPTDIGFVINYSDVFGQWPLKSRWAYLIDSVKRQDTWAHGEVDF